MMREVLLFQDLDGRLEFIYYLGYLNKDIGTADNKLENFLQNTSGCFHTQQEPTWQGKECRAALDHVITWNYHLPPQAARNGNRQSRKPTSEGKPETE